MKYVNLCLGLTCCLLLYWKVDTYLPFQLCELEHNSLLVMDSSTWWQALSVPGGLGEWIGLFGIQFFAFPHWGSMVFLLPVCLLWGVLAFLLHRSGITSVCLPLAFLPVIFLVLSLYDNNYYWSGAIGLTAALTVLCFVLYPAVDKRWRIGLFLLGALPVYHLFGSVVTVYICCGLLLMAERPYRLTSGVPVAVFSLIFVAGWGLDYWSYADFSPSSYYNPIMNAMPVYHWLAWIAPVLLIALVRFLSARINAWRHVTIVLVSAGLWLFCAGGYLIHEHKFRNTSDQDLWRLNHYAFTEEWDKILDFFSTVPLTNQLYMNYANLALANKGMLGDYAFHFQPMGVQALLVNVNNTNTIRKLASDVNYTVGCMGEAQQHAFEALTTSSHMMGVQPLMRLIKTNLVYGHYAVAEKYLSFMEKTLFYKDWAAKYRTFLYNDKAVQEDPELGGKRRGLSRTNRLAMFYGWIPELEDIVEANPENHTAMTYMGLSYLLNKDMEGFHKFLDKYYGSQGLKVLPVSFQQAVIAIFQQEREQWDRYHLSPKVIEQYDQYKVLFVNNRNNPNRKNVMARAFSNTFWYYLMFV